ncbi:hypothetical protein LC653_00930, partial [Nostoc sp. CHAB 5784]|uniref:hypothetical protein n=1 Tax=Nostoc mirabile TaxID=2907820 RepID=UPI001E5C0AC2
ALAIRNRGYTDKTHLRGFEALDFLLVHGGGLCLCSREFYSLCLCSREFYSPNTLKTSFKIE